MTDAHCHVSCGDESVREFLVGRDFLGVHPWDVPEEAGARADALERLRCALVENPRAGVGEIGLDRLRAREIPQRMRDMFDAQLALALELERPVLLHGAKCWGQVVSAVRAAGAAHPRGFARALVFHGFSRSAGLIPEIAAMGGYISIGPAILNDHAANYRELARSVPEGRILVETDRTAESAPVSVRDVLEKLAEVRGVSADALERATDANAEAVFAGCGSRPV